MLLSKGIVWYCGVVKGYSNLFYFLLIVILKLDSCSYCLYVGDDLYFNF